MKLLIFNIQTIVQRKSPTLRLVKGLTGKCSSCQYMSKLPSIVAVAFPGNMDQLSTNFMTHLA